MSVLQITDKASFDQLCSEHANKLILIDFHATWCGPCKQVMPHLPDMATDYPDVVVVKVDVDEADQLSEEFQVRLYLYSPSVLKVTQKWKT